MTDHSQSRFWDNFILKTKTHNVNPRAARWYVRHAETYIKAHPGVRLKQPGVSAISPLDVLEG